MGGLGIRNTNRNAPRIRQAFEAILKRLNVPGEPVRVTDLAPLDPLSV